MVQSILANGRNYSWVDLKFNILGIAVMSLTEINYDAGRDKKLNYGVGDEPTSYGVGNKVYSGGSITLLEDEVRQIINASPNKDITLIPPFPIIIIFAGDGVPFSTDTIKNCMFTKDSFKATQGNTGMYRTIPFTFAGLSRV